MVDATSSVHAKREFDLVLVLGGGNALGAFQGGIYEALHEHVLLPDWLIGASVGAINGAIIVGSEPESRVAQLRAFWQPNDRSGGGSASSWMSELETLRRTAAVHWTMMIGKPGIFGPRLFSLAPLTADRPSLFETDQLEATLERLVDFDRLNAGECRFTATAVDLENGDDVVFDSHDRRIEACHIRASAALPVAFPPVCVDGRWMVDAGMSANLPLDPILSKPPSRPTLCLAIDLLPLGGQVPRTIGESAHRMQDLIFAAQSRRTVERWRMVHADNDEVSLSLARIAYTAQADEVAGKAMDFSAVTIARRWSAGYAAGLNFISRLNARSIAIGEPGLSIVTE